MITYLLFMLIVLGFTLLMVCAYRNCGQRVKAWKLRHR